MPKKKYDFFASGYGFLTREQVVQTLGVPRHVVDRLIATGQLTQYRTASGVGRRGQRVFYSRLQVERIRSQVGAKKNANHRPSRASA